MTIRVVVADDNPLVRMGLRSLLDTSDELDVVGEAADGAEAVELVERLVPDVVLLDVRMPRLDGIGTARRIADRAKVLMLTSSEEPETIEAALATGASGYLVHGAHGPDEIVAAVLSTARGSMVLGPAAAAAATTAFTGESHTTVASGRGSLDAFGLTAREREIMALVADGLSNREIARSCFLAEKTVKNHLNRVFAKLGVRTRAAAVSCWLKVVGAERAKESNVE